MADDDVPRSARLSDIGPALKPLAEGDIIGEIYRIRRELGQGAMGQIYEADDLVLKRRVALKVPLNDVAATLLLAEARALAALRHPNLPVVHAAGRHERMGFMVMERLHGETLDAHVEKAYDDGRPLGLAEGLRLLIAIIDALHAIHHAGIVHRDIKPENVLMCDRGPVLIDLGLVESEHGIGSDELVYGGSPYYMAPEMVQQHAKGGAGYLSDLYSFGVMAYEVLTGEVPYNADEVEDLLRLHIVAPIPDARALRPDLPAALADLLRELMAKKPGERPQTAEDVLWQLRSIASRVGETPPVNRPCALIVSDDLALCSELRHHLSSWVPRIEVGISNDADQGLKELAARRPQLVLVDLQLGNADGIELLMQMQGLGANRPKAIVALAASTAAQDLQLLRHMGVNSTLTKGIALAESLERIVRNVLATRDAADHATSLLP